jgi:hypothetical protein
MTGQQESQVIPVMFMLVAAYTSTAQATVW